MQINNILLTGVDKYEADKDGNPYTYTSKRDGKKHKFVRVVVSYDGSTEKISHTAFEPNDPILEWEPGETHEVSLTQNGNFVNFSEPSRMDYLEYRVDLLEKAYKSLTREITADEPPAPKEEKAEEEVEW